MESAKSGILAVTDPKVLDERGQVKVGTKVEVRPNNVDELFYAAKVLKVNENGTYKVVYEDRTIGDDLRESSIIAPSQQKVVHTDEVVHVVDGHVWMNEEVLDARLMSFASSPHLCQSAIIFRRQPDSGDSSIAFDYKVMAFDIDQAMLLSLPAINVSKKKLPSATGFKQELSVCVLGAGAGSIIMGILEMKEKASVQVVELCPQVIDLAHKFFGVPLVHDRLTIEINDGFEFLRQSVEKGEFYDLIVVDVAEAPKKIADDAVPFELEEGADFLDLPPENFLEEEFICRILYDCLSSNGWAVMNVLGSKERLSALLNMAMTKYGSVYMLGTDPNYALFLSREKVDISPTELVMQAYSDGFMNSCKPVLEEVLRTAHFFDRKILLGWFTGEEFLELLDSSSILI